MTGGAGFIGSNFVHHLVDHTDAAVTVLDKLTYAASREALAGLPRTGSSSSSATSPTPRWSTRWSPSTTPSCTTPPSPTTTTPSTTPRRSSSTNLIGTFTLLEAVRKPGVALPPHLHRRGLRRPRARRPEAVHRGHAVQPVSPVLRHQGRLRPPGPRVGALLRRAGDDLQLLQQLRPVAAHREVHPAPDHQRHRRHPARSSTARAQRPRLDPRRRPQLARCWTILDKGQIGETYLIGADGEKNNLEVVALILKHFGQPAGRLRPRHRPRRPRPALRHRLGQAAQRARLAAAVRRLRVRPGRHHRVVPEHEDWWRPHKQPTEATYAAKGQ